MFYKKDTMHVRLLSAGIPVLQLLLQQLVPVMSVVERRFQCIRFFYRVHPPAFRPTKVNLVGVIVTSGQIFLPFCLLQFNCRAPDNYGHPYGRAS